MDKDFLFKHIFRGPYFDLLKTTGLKKLLSYNDYSNLVSKEMLERICFRSVMNQLNKSGGMLFFEDDSKETHGMPDCYYRFSDPIFLIESKAYIFPDELADKPDFDTLRNYIDERLIQTTAGSPKGVGQLTNAISRIRTGGYAFDRIPETELKKLHIFPIIVHNDFQFSLPGINEYLNETMHSLVPSGMNGAWIENLSLINLDSLFDLSMRNCSFSDLENMITRYHNLIAIRKNSLGIAGFSANDFIKSKASFDETYQFEFIGQLPLASENERGLLDVLEFAGLTQEILDEIV